MTCRDALLGLLHHLVSHGGLAAGLGTPMRVAVLLCAGGCAAWSLQHAWLLLRLRRDEPRGEPRKEAVRVGTAAFVAAIGVSPLIWTVAHVL